MRYNGHMGSDISAALSKTPQDKLSGGFLKNSSELLSDLGFELLFERKGQPLGAVIKQRCHEMVSRLPPSRRPDIILSSTPTQKHCQVWYHPSGFIATTVMTANSLDSDASFDFPSLYVRACRAVPFTGGNLKAVTSWGQFIEPLEFAATPGSFSKDSLSQFFRQAQDRSLGPLLSFNQWHKALSDPIQHDDGALDPIKVSPHPWVELALPWDEVKLTTRATQVPFMQFHFSQLAIARYEKQLKQAALFTARGLPDGIRELILASMRSGIYRNMTESRKNEKSSGSKHHAAFTLRDVVVSSCQEIKGQDYLTPEQCSVFGSWTKELLNKSRASSLRWAALPFHMPGIEGFSRLDMALSATSNVGARNKVFHCLTQSSETQLAQWCAGKGCSRPLALSLARIFLTTDNKPYSKEDVSGDIEFASKALSLLIERLGKDSLVWEDGLGNVWGHALGLAINLPVDEDLVEVQEEKTLHFLAWAIENEIPLPSTVKWSASRYSANPGLVCQASLLDRKDFARIWPMGSREVCASHADLHWDLLSPAVSYCKKIHLERGRHNREAGLSASVPSF